VIVVGAGAFGVSSALELRRRGYAVQLLDPGPLPHPLAASTDVSKVIRVDYGHDEFYMALGEEAMAAWEAWNRTWPRPLFHADGFAIMSRTPMTEGTFEGDSFRLLLQRGHSPERLDGPDLEARFPAWNGAAYEDGYFNPRGGWAESGAVILHLLAEAVAAGVVLREGTTVTRLLERGSRVSGVITENGALDGHCVVVAAGAWTPTLLPWLGDVMWAAGQPVFHFHVDDPAPFRAPTFTPWAADISNTGWYGFPALDDGRVKVANHGPGLRVDPDGPREIPDGTENRFRRFLAETFPALAEAPVAYTRLCLYCDTFDSDLWIDRDPDRGGLIVAAGGSGHGFKFLPVIGAIVADVLEGRDNPWAHRFRWRARGDARTEPARHGG
jgi:glycine/D-amino acid oxidase-like deaminating enzyme